MRSHVCTRWPVHPTSQWPRMNPPGSVEAVKAASERPSSQSRREPPGTVHSKVCLLGGVPVCDMTACR